MMFKVVETWLTGSNVDAELGSTGFAIVDLQLVSDTLANDATLLDKEGVKQIVDGAPRYSQAYLRDRMTPAEFSDTFERLTTLLIELSQGRDFLLFLRPPRGFDETEFDEFYSISAYCDGGLMNGSIDIVRIPSGELRNLAEIWGEYDGVRGLAVDPETPTADILKHFALSSPEPTTVGRFDQRQVGVSSLMSVLPEVGFFFEEVGNSTRVRIASANQDQAQLSASIEKCVTPVGN